MWTALHDAVSNRSVSRVEQLLSRRKEDVDAAAGDGQTALHIASHYAYNIIMETLLKAKADCNAKTHQGATPLHLAARSGSTTAVKLLLSHGAVSSLDEQGRAPEQYAGPGSFGVVDLLTGSSHRVDGSALPRGWVMCWSEEHQKPYYQNNETEVTTWDDPRRAQMIPTARVVISGDNDDEALTNTMERDLRRVADERRSRGWKRTVPVQELNAEGLRMKPR